MRINAEDPFNDFIPSPKKIESLNFAGGIGVRLTHLYMQVIKFQQIMIHAW